MPGDNEFEQSDEEGRWMTRAGCAVIPISASQCTRAALATGTTVTAKQIGGISFPSMDKKVVRLSMSNLQITMLSAR